MNFRTYYAPLRAIALSALKVFVVLPGAFLMLFLLAMSLDGRGLASRFVGAADAAVRGAPAGQLTWTTCADEEPFETGLEPLHRPKPCAAPIVESISIAEAQARIARSIAIGYALLVVMGLMWLPLLRRQTTTFPRDTPA